MNPNVDGFFKWVFSSNADTERVKKGLLLTASSPDLAKEKLAAAMTQYNLLSAAQNKKVTARIALGVGAVVGLWFIRGVWRDSKAAA